MKNYPASLDALSKIITGSVFIFLAFFVYQGFFSSPGKVGAIPVYIACAVFILTLLACYFYHTTSYSLEEGNLIVHRPAGKKLFPLREIESADPVSKEDKRGMIRTFGNGGLFGYWGKFYNSRLGNIMVYASRRDNWILVKMKNGKKIVLSPDDVTLADEIRSKITG